MIKKLMMLCVAAIAAIGASANPKFGFWVEMHDVPAQTCSCIEHRIGKNHYVMTRLGAIEEGTYVAIPVYGLDSELRDEDVFVTAGTYKDAGSPFVWQEEKMWAEYGQYFARAYESGDMYENIWDDDDIHWADDCDSEFSPQILDRDYLSGEATSVLYFMSDFGPVKYELVSGIWDDWKPVLGRQWIIVPTPKASLAGESGKITSFYVTIKAGSQYYSHIVEGVDGTSLRKYKSSNDIATVGAVAVPFNAGTVSGNGEYKNGSTVTLKAAASKGYVFIGWYDAEDNPFPNDREFRLVQLPYTVGDSDVDIYAKFAKLSGNITVSAKSEAGMVFAGWYTDDAFTRPYISSDGKDYRTASMSYPVPLYAALFPRFVSTEEDMQISLGCNPLPYYDANSPMSLGVLVDSCSLPTVTAANLPAGLNFDAKTLMISGTPTKPGEGKDVKFTVKNLTNKKGETFIVSIKIGDARAASLPDLKYNDADGYAPFVPGASQDMSEVLGASTMDVLAQGGWTVSGLPAGMKFDSKTGKFSGTPTKANENCTVTFKKGTEVATITLRTGALPPLNITSYLLDDDKDDLAEIPESRAKDFKVTGAGGYAVGKAATLSATAPKGYVFAGWYTDVECTMPAENGTQDYRTTSSYKFTMPEEATSETGVRLYAMFIHASHDFAGVEDLSDWGDGITVEINQSESMPADFIKNAVFSGSLPTVTVKGLPAGLKFDAKTLLISGKATDKTSKWYDLIVSVKNVAGYTFTGIFGISVNGGTPVEDIDDLGISWKLDWLDSLYVGDIVKDESCFGTSSDGVTGVTGLPAEMKLYKETEDGETFFLVAEVNDEMPVIKTPGVYTITVNGKKDGKAAKTTKRFVIRDSESIYERVVVANGCEDKGTVTGNGTIVHPGSSFSINATAKKGYVFAGWYADPDCQSRAYFMPEFADYRQASQKASTVSLDTYSDDFDIAIAPTTLNPEIWYAKFVGKADDAEISIEDIGHQRDSESYYYQEEFVFDLEELKKGVEIQLAVVSGSLPTITFKNLPSWMGKDSHQYFDGFWLWYNWKSQPAPGEYSFTMIAKNASGAVDEKKITIVVPNYTDANDYFEDEYFGNDDNATADGRLSPSVGITNIDDFLPSLRMNSPTAKLAVSGLPAGLKYDATNGKIIGVATKPGVYTVTLTVTDGKEKYISTITVEVEALPDWVVGTFEGYFEEYGWYDEWRQIYPDSSLPSGCDWEAFGRFTVTISKKARLAASLLKRMRRKHLRQS